MARKVGRPRSGKEVLSRERILAAGLRLIDEHGVDALSMRRLAAALGVDPMAIYHHIGGKEALLEGIIESVFAGMRVHPEDGAGWQERVRAFAHAYRELVRAHPQLALYLASNLRAGTESVLAANEVLYEALEQAGLPPHRIVQAADVVVDYLNGVALAEGFRLSCAPGASEDLSDLLARYPAGRFPAMHRTLNGLSAGGAPADDEAGLHIILAGIAALL